MKIKEMNEALQWLRDKYAVKADGTLTATAPDFIGAGAELKRSQNSSRGDRNAVSSSSKNSWTAKLWRMFPHSASQQ